MSNEIEKDSKQLKELMSALESTTTLIQTLIVDLKANSGALGSLEAQVNSIQKDLDDLEVLVRGGDQPLLTKLALMSKDIDNLEKQINILMKQIKEDENKNATAAESIWKSRTHIVGVIITGLLGIIASMITYFLSQGN